MAETNRHNLLQHIRRLADYRLVAADGEIGSVADAYFDEQTWRVHYFAIRSGEEARQPELLVSPLAIGDVDETGDTVTIELTRDQIENGPTVDLEAPPLREDAKAAVQPGEWPGRWAGSPLAGRAPRQAAEARPRPEAHVGSRGAGGARLHRGSELMGIAVQGTDGVVGRVAGLVLDTRYWIVRYLDAAASNRSLRRRVLLHAGWVVRVHWARYVVEIDVSRDAVSAAPAFDPAAVISREYEKRLFAHYGRPGYWRGGKGGN